MCTFDFLAAGRLVEVDAGSAVGDLLGNLRLVGGPGPGLDDHP